jgi:acyl dehydratase
MAINYNALGKETPWVETIVTQQKIDALCDALEDYNPLFRDPTVAAGTAYGGIIAPPTFINLFRERKSELLLSELEVDLPRLLHGEQDITYYAPVRPGDRVLHRIKVVDVGKKKSKTYGQLDHFTVLITVKGLDGRKLVEATQLFFVRED